MSSGSEKNLPNVDKHDVALLRSLSQFIWIQGEPLLLVYEIGHEIYTTEGIDFPMLKRLEVAGLLSMDTAGYVKKWFGKHTRLFYFGRPTKIQFPQDSKNQLDLGHVILTEQGKALAQSFHGTRNQKFYDYTIEIWFRHGLVTSSILPPDRSI